MTEGLNRYQFASRGMDGGISGMETVFDLFACFGLDWLGGRFFELLLPRSLTLNRISGTFSLSLGGVTILDRLCSFHHILYV
jgi:hypothetical protein